MLSDKLRSASAVSPPEGGITFGDSGTYTFVVPAGVSSLSVLCIGGGGGGGGTSAAATNSAAGGGGGGLSYSNNVSVTPGETLTVVVGAAGAGGTTAGTNGTAAGDSYLRRSSTDLVLAKGGSGGGGNTAALTGGAGAGGASASGVGDVRQSGGAGGARNSNDRGGGGGGAAGYSGTGGTGGTGTTNPTTGNGGGGGGGFTGFDGTSLRPNGGVGGGTQFYGAGANGIAGIASSANSDAGRNGGLGSSNGSTAGGFTSTTLPGGGGGGGSSDGVGNNARAAADGAVRILWGGDKAFPSTGVTSNTVTVHAVVSSDTSTITIPSDVQTGDLLVLIDLAFGSSTPSSVTPSGWTNISMAIGENGRILGHWRQVFSNAIGGLSVTGMNGNVSNNKILVVLRGTSGYSSTGPYAIVTQQSQGISLSGMPSTTLGANARDPYVFGIPVNLLFVYGSDGVDPSTDISFSGATFVQGASNVAWLGYKVSDQSTENASTTGVSTVDRGTNARYAVLARGL
jgi:hypothetical protein